MFPEWILPRRSNYIWIIIILLETEHLERPKKTDGSSLLGHLSVRHGRLFLAMQGRAALPLAARRALLCIFAQFLQGRTKRNGF